MEFEISLRTSGIHDQDTDTSHGVHSEITIRLDLPGVIHIVNKDLLREGLMELLRLDNAITNNLTSDEIIEFKTIKDEL
jgi:hypothetical protein